MECVARIFQARNASKPAGTALTAASRKKLHGSDLQTTKIKEV
nr:MAG TPA: hypothetical protein [Caudoviricetes sp.]